MEIDIIISPVVAKKFTEGKRNFKMKIKEGYTFENFKKELGFLDKNNFRLIFIVNGEIIYGDKMLNEGDVVKILPFAEGG